MLGMAASKQQGTVEVGQIETYGIRDEEKREAK
jgi:hypothetical protein